jgi:rRNA maturation RNase YbeY
MSITHLSDQDAPYDFVQLFNTTEISLPITQRQLQEVASIITKHHHVGFEMVEIVYVDDDGIVDINKTYLDKDYVTDIITFRLDEGDDNAIEGTLYCCAPRIIEQANEMDQNLETEFIRVAVHGILHLIGMDDSTEDLKKQMTKAEDEIITIWKITGQ